MARESKRLKRAVFERFERLQNPENCETAKLITCPMKLFGGFGARIHELLRCFMLSIQLNRTLVLNTTEWFFDSRGYYDYFKPISRACLKPNKHVEKSIFLKGSEYFT
jgi:hypothetical protein